MRRLFLRLILPVATALAVIFGLNAWLAAAGLEPRLSAWGKTYDDWDVVYTKALADQQAGKRIVAFIGDSRIEWGLDPDAVQAALDENGIRDVAAYNLALPGRNVRSILERLLEVGFRPDVLVVGYSHLSFYWSKNFVEVPPHALNWWDADAKRIQSLLRRKVLMWNYDPVVPWLVLTENYKVANTALGSWLSRIDVTPRGQARVAYRIAETDAIEVQHGLYAEMYGTEITPEAIAAIEEEFRSAIATLQAQGTEVLLLKMPLSGWARDLEIANEPKGLPELAAHLGVSFLDGNEQPGVDTMKTFDGLHLMPADAARFSRAIGEDFVLPHL